MTEDRLGAPKEERGGSPRILWNVTEDRLHMKPYPPPPSPMLLCMFLFSHQLAKLVLWDTRMSSKSPVARSLKAREFL